MNETGVLAKNHSQNNGGREGLVIISLHRTRVFPMISCQYVPQDNTWFYHSSKVGCRLHSK